MVRGQQPSDSTSAQGTKSRKGGGKGISNSKSTPNIGKGKERTVPSSSTPVPSCGTCGIMISNDTRALQCDGCNLTTAWKCAECLNLTNDVYDQLVAGCDLKWLCPSCDLKISSTAEQDRNSTKLDQITDMLQMLITKTDSIEEQIREKANKEDLDAVIARLEVLEADTLSARHTVSEVRQTVEELSDKNHSRQEIVKDYVEKAVEVKTLESREEEADRDRRKTSVIVHGLPESAATDSDVRQTDDAVIITTMLQDISCEAVEIKQAIRLGKSSSNGHTSTTDVKPRPVKLVFNSENNKATVLKASKNLASIKEGKWKRVFIHQDLTVKERETRKVLIQELKRRAALGETDLTITNGKIVKRKRNKDSLTSVTAPAAAAAAATSQS